MLSGRSVKDEIIATMDIGYPIDVIEKVIAFQGEDMLKATKLYSEIEISGIGLLYVAQGKLKNRIASTEKSLATCQKKFEESPTEENEIKVNNFTEKLEFLKSKLRCQS